ncbi:MAG: ribulose-phosphate 3-epimerase [Bacilli bacterium]|nr:ribulose-phosphate 3-epimerase [Bacilli bacterium]
MKVSVSILSSSIKGQDITKKLDNTKADYIHVDIMDGKFVENKTWTYGEVKKIVSYSKLPLDVHLMVEKPERYIEDYAMLNTSYLTFHIEAVQDINQMIESIKDYGLKVGIAINPETPVDKLFPYLKYIDQVLVMGVHPGKSGQSFIENTPDRIKKIKDEIINQGINTIVSVDGGVNNETGLLCKEAGVDMLVSATYLHNDLINNINILKSL